LEENTQNNISENALQIKREKNKELQKNKQKWHPRRNPIFGYFIETINSNSEQSYTSVLKINFAREHLKGE
jgi:hypothetical protein